MTPPVDYEPIILAEMQLLNAFKTNDIQVLEAMLHVNCLLVLPNGLTLKKDQVIENYRTSQTTMSAIDASDQQMSLVGDNVVVSVKLHLKGRYGETPIDATYRYLRVWKNTGGHWQVIAGAGIPL